MKLERRMGKVSQNLMLLASAALMVYALTMHEPVSAQQTAPIAGNHLDNVALTAELPDSQTLTGAVIMALNHRDALNQLAADLQSRDSPSYHQWLTPELFAARFGPTPEQMQAVADWLGQGLTVIAMDRLSRAVRFSGSYAQIKAAMGVKLVTDGQTYVNLEDPQVPADLAPTIVSIEGLTSNDGGSVPAGGDSIVSSCILKSGGSCSNTPHFGPADSTPSTTKPPCSRAAIWVRAKTTAWPCPKTTASIPQR